jgi:GNAT superfamily N-acetyltransferase
MGEGIRSLPKRKKINSFMEIKFQEFNPKSASPNLWNKYLALFEEIQIQIEPNDPPILKENNRKLIESALRDSKFNQFSYLMFNEEEDALIGIARVFTETPKSPSYQTNARSSLVGTFGIAKKYQRQGLGTKLFKHVMADIKRSVPIITEFVVNVFSDSAERFILSLGGEISDQRSRSRLYLQNINWPELEHWLAQAQKKAPNVRFETVSLIPEDNIEEYSALYTEVINDSPFGTLSRRTKETPESLCQQHAAFLEMGISNITVFSREESGAISGLTNIIYDPARPYKIMQGLTGVKKEYRGRELGKILKIKMLFHIRKHHIHAKYIETETSCKNEGMLKINHALGFRKHCPKSTCTIAVD